MTRVFGWCFSILIFSMSLSACVRTVTPSSFPKELPFTDADIDTATVLQTTPQIPPDLQELDESGETTELPPIEHKEERGEIESAAVLPGATGFVYYFERDQAQSEPWSAYLFDQQTDEYILLYRGSRQIQSVGGSVDGNVIILSMRETTDTTSDYEIYRLQLNTSQVVQLTDNSVDDTHVSLSANGLVSAWQTPNASGVNEINIHSYPDSSLGSSTLTTLRSSVSQVQPSLSSNGNYLVFIRELLTGRDVIIRYQRSLKIYTTLVVSTIPLEHPSISDDGSKVLWLQHNTTGDIVRLKNQTTNTSQTVVNNIGAIRHPFLTSDGLFLTYGAAASNGRFAVFTKSLTTAAVAQNTAPPNTANHAGMSWVLPTRGSLQINFAGLPGPWANPGQGYVTITGPNGFEEEMFTEDLLTNLEPGIYTITTNPLSICEEYYGTVPEQLVEVNYNETTTVFVDYIVSNSFLITPQFRAKVQGAYSNGVKYDAGVQILSKDNQFHVFGCVKTFYSPDQNYLQILDVGVYQGNMRNHFIGSNSLIKKLQFDSSLCSEVPQSCIRYIYGTPIISSTQMQEFNKGNTYLWILEIDIDQHEWLSQLPVDSSLGRGGNLRVTVSLTGLPPELRNNEICLSGLFRLTDRLPCIYPGTPANTDTFAYFYADLFSDKYSAYVVTLTANDGSQYKLKTTSVDVRPGTTAILNISFTRNP